MLEQFLAEAGGGFNVVPALAAVTRLVAAIILGGMIGYERERQAKAAGLRTHMLISMAACLFVIISQELVTLPYGRDGDMRVDPLRLIEAVTAGVAFLAAGAIFTQGEKVRNLTTGAGMWLAGSIGLACGAGLIPLAIVAAVIALVVLWILRRLIG